MKLTGKFHPRYACSCGMAFCNDLELHSEHDRNGYSLVTNGTADGLFQWRSGQKPPDWILTYWLCIGVSTKLISSKRHMLHIGRHTAHRARTTHKLLLHLTHRRSFALKIGLLEDLASRGLIADITRSERRLRVIKYFSLPCTSDLTSSRST